MHDILSTLSKIGISINKFVGIPDYTQCVDRFLKACDNQAISKTERIARAKNALANIEQRIDKIETMRKSTISNLCFTNNTTQHLNTLKWQCKALTMYINGMPMQDIKKQLALTI